MPNNGKRLAASLIYRINKNANKKTITRLEKLAERKGNESTTVRRIERH
jgi:hypothetical protein